MLKSLLITVAFLFSATTYAQGFFFPTAHQTSFSLLKGHVITVTNSKQEPVADAEVIVLSGEEFAISEYVTDEMGQVYIPSDLEEPLTVKLKADGFIPEVSADLDLSDHTFSLDDDLTTSELEVSGKTINYGRLKKDGFIDFALVIPSLEAKDMIFFDVSDIISPLTDKIILKNVGQEFDIPSNVSLPRQSESYLIFNIKFNKPEYRLKLSRQGTRNIVATHGKFNLKKVIKDRKKSPLELLKHFDFLSSGSKEKLFINDTKDFDIDVNQTQFTTTQSVTVPNYSPENTVISVGLANNGSKFYPTDVKRLLQNETKALKFPADTKGSKILSALVNKDIDFKKITDTEADKKNSPGLSQLSLTFSEPNSSVNFLNLINPPAVDENTINISAPVLPAELKESGVLIILSEIEKIKGGEFDTEKRTRIWQGRSYSWINRFDVPDVAKDLDPAKNYRWEVLFMAQSNEGNLPRSIENVTHVTRNAFDF